MSFNIFPYPGNADFPNPEVGSSTTTHIPIVRTETDGNYTRSRRKASRARHLFKLVYPHLTYSQTELLKNFFNVNQGSIFIYNDSTTWQPLNQAARKCIFSTEDLEIVYNGTTCAATVQIEEV